MHACTTEVDAGRLDGAAFHAVLEAAGHQVRRRVRTVAGLTARELEVLEMLVRGLSGRAAAAMVALQHGLVDPSVRAEDR